MKIKVKKLHPDAVLPASAKDTDAGFDLVCIDDGEVNDTYVQYRTGIAIEPPPGYHTEIFPRSSNSKTDCILANSIGLVDEGYRGEILIRYKLVPRVKYSSDAEYQGKASPICGFELQRYKKGDRIAQLVIRKTERANFEWAEELADSSRGAGGFGSSGR